MFAIAAKTAIYVLFGYFEVKHFFGKNAQGFTPLWTLSQKWKDLSRKVFFSVVTTAIRSGRGIV